MDNEIELSTIGKAKSLLHIENDIDKIDLYHQLLAFRNKNHPDQYYDEETKKEANELFIKANDLLRNITILINREKLEKTPAEISIYNKDYEIVNIQQNIIDNEMIIEENNKKIMAYRKIKKNILEQNKLLSNQLKENNQNILGLKNIYKNNRELKIGLGIKLFFTLLLYILLNIDRIAEILTKYFPFSNTLLNIIIFSFMFFSIIVNIRKLLQNTIVETRAREIETVTFTIKFSEFIKKEEHFGIKINEKQIIDFIKNQFNKKNKFGNFIDSLLKTNNEIIFEKYKNIFIYYLIEKQLINISKAKELNREFYVFGTSWGEKYYDNSKEINSEIITDEDIDTILDTFE
jgi:hypothetical protein